MSDEHDNSRQSPEPAGENNSATGHNTSAAPPPSAPLFTRHFMRISAASIGVASLLVLVILALAFWYSTTSGFENRVRNIVVAQLEQSTGGRVDLSTLHVNLAQLGIEADNLTIHGKEAPGQIPYFHADKLAVHLKIIDFFAGKIGLSYLGLTRPTIHIIVYPDGSTNQPTPRVTTNTTAASVSTQIFNLAIDQAQLNHGLIILNASKYRFNAQAEKLRANLSYDRLRNHYLGNFAATDILLQRPGSTPVSSRLYIQIDAAPNRLHLDHLTFLSGDSRLNITGNLNNFAHPQFQGHARGSLDLRALDPLTGITGIQSGVLHLQADANGTPASYVVQGTAQLDHLIYQPLPNQTISLSAQSQLMLTQDEISATAFHAQFTGGGSASGNLQILHWLRTVAAAPASTPETKHTLRWFFRHKKTPPPPAPRPEPPLTGKAHLQLANLPLSTLLHAISPPQFGDLGFNTSISGPVDAHWTTTLSSLTATANLQLAPGSSSRLGDVPVTGKISGSYAFAAAAVQLRALDLHTPGTHAQASGSIGINPSMRGSKITGSIVTHNLAEFDKILAALNVQPQSQSLPFDLHGNAAFHGAVTGSLTAPDVQGHLDATNLDIAFQTSSTPPAKPVTHSIHIDSAQAGLDYSPLHFTLSALTLRAGEATANASLTINSIKTGRNSYALDKASPISGQATLSNATLTQIMPLLGTQVPATGTLDLQLQLAGTLGNPSGTGSLTVNGGAVYGEPYRDLEASLSLANQSLQATNILYRQVGGQVHGSAQLDLNTQQFHFDLTGSGFHLAQVHRLQTPNYPLGGVLDFQSQGSGTLQNPSISANLHLAQLQFADAATGSIDATAQLQNQSLTLDAAAHLNQSLVQLHGQATLSGNDPAHAKLTITNLDLNPLAKTFHISGIASRRPINATATLQGPLTTPQALSGDILIQPIALSLAKVDLQSTSSIHAALQNGTLTLDPFHIQGANVDVQAQGSIGLTGNKHPIQWHTRGSINMKVAQTFSDEITSSGMVTFNVNAGGSVHHPSLNGKATIKDVNLASDDYINGLSRINGTLNFNEGRVELQNVTAYSGGGPIQLSGSATYAAGLYLNIKATAQGVRVRYPAGVTSMVDAKMQLQGGIQSLLLSGNVQVTHFAVNSTMDLVSIVNSSSAGPSLPPNPKSLANRVRLEIHVTSSPSMDFQNSFAKLAGTVNLHIRGTAAQPSILGQITITEGQATLAGTTYQLQRGVIYFNNPIRIEPTIDLDATTRVENYDITIGLHGTPSKLQPVFRSSPPLSEQDIFSLLALGRTQEEQQIYSQQQSQAGISPAANALLGSAINATVSSRIQKLFGGGSVKINPAYVTTSGNATARLTVQQQIAKNFTLTYATNVNSSAQQLIQGKLDITPSLSILAVRDETGVFSLIFTIRKRYK
jgi:translocation and assembly module TamB